MNGARLLIRVTLSIFAGTFFQGCGLVRGVMSASYHVATEPVRAIQRGVTRPTPGATTTTTTVTRTAKTGASDVTVPGHPVASSSSAQQRPRRVIGTSSAAASPTPAPKMARKESRQHKVSQKRAVSSQPAASAQAGYPTAKPVADKPGYVFSPFDSKRRYVDVSGYAPGSKVKDPWTNQIFIVP